MAEKDLLSVVIPCYKSEKTISSVIEKEIRIFEENGISRYEFILVNDCSPDHTWETLTELGHKYPFVKCIRSAFSRRRRGWASTRRTAWSSKTQSTASRPHMRRAGR